MNKLTLLFGLGMMAWQAQQLAYAHAVVTDYSLKMQPVRVNEASTVALKFNSKIELGLSQIFLVSKGDKHSLLNITVGQKQGEILISLPPLGNGDYALRLKVFAADGHLTEDVIHFEVGSDSKAMNQSAAADDRQ